jgi:hypothetical protein
MNALLNARANLILDAFGPAQMWTDLTAIMLCPVWCLPDAYRGGRYLAAQGRHAENLFEGMGQAIRRMHQV